MVAPLEMKEGTPLGVRAQSAIQRAAVLYKPRLATFDLSLFITRDLVDNNNVALLIVKSSL
jgi:hypothetical protein